MSTAQKRGFKLPWSSDRDPTDMDPEEDAQRLTAFLQAASGATAAADEAEELGEGPFERQPDVAAPEAAVEPVLPQAEQESEAVVLESMVQDGAGEPNVEELSSSEPITADAAAGWPTADLKTSPPAVAAEPAPEQPAPVVPRPRRDNLLVMGLVRAMRQAAESSRGEAIAAVQAEATAQIETIKAGATDDAAALRKQAEDDMTAIREWAKVETARIRQESEQRITERREAQARELEDHAAVVEARIAEVEAAVVRYGADMDRFFEELLAEGDPARLATLAERAPEPPNLAELPGVRHATTSHPGGAVDPDTTPVEDGVDALAQEDAAAAEAEAFDGFVQLPDSGGAERAGGQEDGTLVTALVVNGLATVAGISAFKGVLGQLPGVEMVSVSAGEPGTFVFSVAHAEETDLRAAVPELAAFGAQITSDQDGTIQISAQEPAA